MATAENQELVDRFEQFYRRYYSDEIGKLARSYPSEQRSLYIDWTDIYRFDPDLADDFVSHPLQMREYAEEALRLYDLPVDVSLGQAHVRIKNLHEQTSLSEIRSNHLSSLVEIYGTVETASAVSSQPTEAAWECHRCGTLNYRPVTDFDNPQKPLVCEGCERQGPFSLNRDQSEFVDHQKVRIQERITGVGSDDDIESIIVHFYDDLVKRVEPGDHVVVTGTLKREELGEHNDGSISDKYIEASSVREAGRYHHISLTETEKKRIVELSSRQDIYEQVVDSIAPSIYGYEQVKMAIALQLFSGVSKTLPDGSRVRGDIHLMLVGDPGTAKTPLIRAAANLAPRAVRASGKNTTEAGLTTAATPTGKGSKGVWELEAGVLVLANQGLACIDDISDFREEHQRALHSVLEQQELDVSKASITKTLDARTSVIAAGNPRWGRFDQYESIGKQFEFDPALLSQFDLIFALADKPDPEEDGKLADHILDAHKAGELATHQQEVATSNVDPQEVESAVEPVEPEIDSNILRKYIAYAQRNCYPTMTEEAKERIKEFYVDIRSQGAEEDAPVPVTARKLEALVRFSEASARIRLSDQVTVADADRVISIVKSCLQDLGIDPETGQYNADVVETDTRKSQRDRIKNIKDIIFSLEDEEEYRSRGVPEENIISAAKDAGISPKKAEREIEKLRLKGEVYQPAEDCYRST